MARRFVVIASLFLVRIAAASTSPLELPLVTSPDDPALAKAAPALARNVIVLHQDAPRDAQLDARFRLQLVAGASAEALATLRELRNLRRATDPVSADGVLVQYEIFGKALLRPAPVVEAYKQTFREAMRALDDKAAYYVLYYLADEGALARTRGDLERVLRGRTRPTITLPDAVDLLRKYQLYQMERVTVALHTGLVAEDDARRYLIDDKVMIRTPEGATLSATIFRKRGVNARSPTALMFTIYPERLHDSAREAAAHGYVGMIADTRGKRLSPDTLSPYDHEVEDTRAVIEWIARQPWSDGQVGMWGNSYSGFAQWAATKRLPPALKTIVPSAAAIPGLGLPMENNVFLNANYGWAFYVSDTNLLDNKVYFDPGRWSSLNQRWYESGRPYREIDQVDGTPNPLLQRWLRHPAYDRFWQAMVPYNADYANINIPVLTITGYYDDGQISALHYLREHYEHNPNANHYLLIGPYQHFSAQSPRKPPIVENYEIDAAAKIDSKEIIFQWMDWVMRGGAQPALLADKINYEVMGANEWRHAPSLAKMATKVLTLYLSDASAGGHYALTAQRPAQRGFLEQKVDLADRKSSTNDYYYPSPIILDSLDVKSGFSFASEPFAEPASIDGMPSGTLKVAINKRDFDVSIVFYELMPNGKLFHLSYFVGRASYARDMTTRHLLTPNKVESIPFERTRLVSRRLAKGSRLLVVVNVNKNPFAQVNYGTGKDVADESVADAKEPLVVRWYNDSFVRIPIAR
jgi:uncharacterized protein